MITLGGFFIGMLMMAIGFVIVWRTEWFIRSFGDVSLFFGAVGAPWFSWKLLGALLLLLGFLFGFGLFQTFFTLTFGRLFLFGGR